MSKDWSPSLRIERVYRDALRRIMAEFMHVIEPYELTDPRQITDLLQAFVGTNWFSEAAYAAASKMITMTRVEGANNWREAAFKSSKGRKIFQYLSQEMAGPTGKTVRRLVDDNAQLISTFPLSVAEQVNRRILQESQKGLRAEAITEELKKQFPLVSNTRISLIARTEVSKAGTALIEARAEALELDWYIWKSSRDVRVRASHRFMGENGGVLVRWSDPPSPESLVGEKSYGEYHAGCTFNCRCWPQVLLDLNDVAWPHRVYISGRVTSMSRRQFASIAGTEVANAAF